VFRKPLLFLSTPLQRGVDLFSYKPAPRTGVREASKRRMMALTCLDLSEPKGKAKAKPPPAPQHLSEGPRTSGGAGGGGALAKDEEDGGGRSAEELELERLFGEDDEREGGGGGGGGGALDLSGSMWIGPSADRRMTVAAATAAVTGTKPPSFPTPPPSCSLDSPSRLPPAALIIRTALEVPPALSTCDLVDQLGLPEALSDAMRRPQGHFLAVHPRGSLVNFKINRGGASGWFKVLQGAMVRDDAGDAPGLREHRGITLRVSQLSLAGCQAAPYVRSLTHHTCSLDLSLITLFHSNL